MGRLWKHIVNTLSANRELCHKTCLWLVRKYFDRAYSLALDMQMCWQCLDARTTLKEKSTEGAADVRVHHPCKYKLWKHPSVFIPMGR